MTLPVYITFHVIEHERLSPGERRAILSLCERAFAESFDDWLPTFRRCTHVMLFERGRLAAHAAWETRRLQAGEPSLRPALRTAYIEAVATEPALQRRGHGTAVMEVVHQQTWDYDLRALCAAEPAFYARLGFQNWRGPCFITTPTERIPTPDEPVMIHTTGRTPDWLDLEAPLAAPWRDAPEQW